MRRTTRLLCTLLAAGALACGSDGSSADVDGGSGGDGGGGGGNPDASIDDVPDRLSYIDTLTIPSVSGQEPSCCYDFGEISKNGTGTDDNALAIIANNPLLEFAGIDFQQVLDDTLENGDQVLLLNHVGLTGPDDSFRMDGLQGDFAEGTTYTEASAGVTTLTATVKEARISGAATLSETAASYTGGELSGYILVDELFAGLNAYAATCTCLGLSGDLFAKGPDGLWDSDCVANAATLCAEEPDCATIAGSEVFEGQACPLVPDLIQNNADIDLNDDPAVYEGLSVGFEWTGQNAAIAP
jgi:hypothetical protein